MRNRILTPDHEQHLGFVTREGEAYSPQHNHADIDRKLNRLPEPGNTTPTGLVWGGSGASGASEHYARSDHAHSYPAYPVPTGPHCEIILNSAQAIPSNIDTTINFNATHDSNGDLRSGNSIVIQQAGRYLVWVCCKWAATDIDLNSGGYGSVHIVLNGGAALVDDHTVAPENGPTSPNLTHNASRVVSLSAGAVITAQVLHFHSVGSGSRNLLAGATLGACFQTP